MAEVVDLFDLEEYDRLQGPSSFCPVPERPRGLAVLLARLVEPSERTVEILVRLDRPAHSPT